MEKLQSSLVDAAIMDAFAFEGVPLTACGRHGSLTYGEITLKSLRKILDLSKRLLVPCETGLTFIDLGSGFGRVVIATACTGIFESVTGLEIVPGFHESAIAALERLQAHVFGGFALMADTLSSDTPSDKVGTKVRFLEGDILECSEMWTSADFVYVCCTCFDDALLAALAALVASRLKRGAVVATVSRKLPTNCLELVCELSVECTWGYADVYIGRKL